MKLLYLFASLFLMQTKKDFLITKEVSEEVVIYHEDLYKITSEEDKILFYYDETVIDYFLFSEDFEYLKDDEGLLIKYLKNKKVYINIYNKNIKTKELILEKGSYQRAKLFYDEEQIYLYGGVKTFNEEGFSDLRKTYHQNTDAFIMAINSELQIIKAYLFGGYLDEWIEGINKLGDCFYFWGRKESLSGGDLGNAGRNENCSFLVSFTWDELIIDQSFLADEWINDLYIDEQIFLVTNKGLHSFNQAFEHQFSYSFPEAIYSKFNSHGDVVIILDNEIRVVSKMTFNSLFISQETFAGNIFIYPNKIIFKKDKEYIKYELFDLRSLASTYEELDSSIIYGLDYHLELLNYEFESSYQADIWGVYPLICNFGEVETDHQIEVDYFVNIYEGRIYPLGYLLEFSGLAYLDDLLIVNSHMLINEGKHKLKIQSNTGAEKEITFYVDSKQIGFKDDYYPDVDVKSYVGKEFVLSFDLELAEGITIDKIIVNNEETEFTFTNPKVTIKYREDTPGIHQYIIEEIHYTYYEKQWISYPNTIFLVNIKKYAPLVNIDFVNYNKAIFAHLDLDDKLLQVRGIGINLISEYDVKNYLICPKDQEIIFTNLNYDEEYIVEIYLAYCAGEAELKKLELFSLKFKANSSKYNLGNLVINQKTNKLEKFSFTINKTNNLLNLYNHEKTLYLPQKVNYTKIIVSSIFISIIIFLPINYLVFRRRKGR